MAIGREATYSDAFDFVFNVHHDYIYNLALALLRNTQDAEDVTQDVFLRVYRSLSSYDEEKASMRTWLAKMAVNACQTYRRRNIVRSLLMRRGPSSGEEELHSQVDPSVWGAPEDHALKTELRRTMRTVLDRLRPEHRTVLVLHYYADLSCAEIASVLGCPEGTVYSRLHYARRIVQDELERHAAADR